MHCKSIFTSLWFLSLLIFHATNSIAQNSQHDYERLSSEIIAEKILKGSSYITRSMRKQFHDSLVPIDQKHLQVCKKFFNVNFDSNTDITISDYDLISFKPELIPVSERYILHMLAIQKKMLERVWKTLNPQTGIQEEFYTAPRKIRVQTKRVFNNEADYYYRDMISLIHDISQLQKRILPNECQLTSGLDKAFTVKLIKVLDFIIQELSILENNATKLNAYNF